MRPGCVLLSRVGILLVFVLLLVGCAPSAAVVPQAPTGSASPATNPTAAATVAPPTVTALPPTATTVPATATTAPPTETVAPATATAEPASSATPAQAAAGGALTAEDKDGLPVPADYTAYVGEQSMFRRGLTATSPSNLADVLKLYRAELTARTWAELPATVAPTDEQADLMFSSPDQGPLSLKLTRNADGGTDISLMIRDQAAAEAAGALPPSGKVRVYFANPNEAEVTFSIEGQDLQVPVDKPGMTIADATHVDLAPGKYPYTLTQTGADPAKDEIQVGEGEIWVLVAGPSGALPIQAY